MSTLLIIWLTAGPAVLTASAMATGRTTTRVAQVAVRSLASATAVSLLLLVVVGFRDDEGRWDGVDLTSWLALGIDRAAALLVLTFVGLGTVVAAFSARALDDGPRSTAHFVWLTVLVGGASLVILPGGPLPLAIGWLTSAWALERLVIGWVDTTTAQAAYRRLRRSMRIGHLALLAALATGIAVAGPELISGSPAAIGDLRDASFIGVGADVVVGLLIVLAGASRSALVPAHRWLSATLYAPTPVSAIVHAGFVSGAGLLLIRFAPVFAEVGVVLAIAGAIGVATIAAGTAASLSRPDVKGGMAWSTVAQMGFMTLQCAIGAFSGALVHIAGHGMYKAAQFLGAGDAVAAGLRKRRRPPADHPPSRVTATAITLGAPTVAIALGLLISPAAPAAEHLLLGGFAWLALVGIVHGETSARTLDAPRAAAYALGGSLVASLAYFGGLRVVKRFLDPSFESVEPSGSISLVLVVVALATIVAIVAIVSMPRWSRRRALVRSWIDRLTELRPHLSTTDVLVGAPRAVDDPTTEHEDGRPDRRRTGLSTPAAAPPAELRAQVSRAAELIAPMWPLSSFVAVNPLGGLERLPFDEAGSAAWPLRCRTFRSLAEFRDDHLSGITCDEDLEWAVLDVAFVACTQAPIVVGEREIAAVDVVIADLRFGAPETTERVTPRTELERRCGVDVADRLGVDELVASWVLDHLARPSWPLDDEGVGFWALARGQAVRHARRRLGTDARNFVEQLDDDPLVALSQSLDALGVPGPERVDELRGMLASFPGCAGLARWRTDWAHGGEPLPRLDEVELAAARACLDAAILIDLDERGGRRAGTATALAGTSVGQSLGTDPTLLARADAISTALELPDDDGVRNAIAELAALVPDPMRQAIWQRAQERHFDRRSLAMLDRVDPGVTTVRPASQVVLCIDVRSEGLRKQLESSGLDETVGFAGFFGVPMQVRELGWDHVEARCPVLVSPGAQATEEPLPDEADSVERYLDHRRRRAAAAAAHTSTKRLAGAQFATAEAVGWLTGPLAAWHTLAPPRVRGTERSPLPTRVLLERDSALEQRVDSAEAVLRTMGLVERFARVVVFCGHTSETTNNPHATALECGACAGASGASNARAVAALMNEPDVRAGLAQRGLEIPHDTWFTGAVHETTTDAVTLLDRHLAPHGHVAELDELQGRLDGASARQATARARHLPGRADRVRDRGRDWAQPRPEWGLARNAAFIIAPRSATEGLDLDGRAFLHSYDSRHDPDGTVLETIMTAPLVVGHWISAQYYFSTVDPDTFGAGDKLLHNPVGSVGVLSGAGGDLRVGLPLQSTHVAGRRFHQPLRLLAVIQADLSTIEAIIARNPVLQQLVAGSWIRIAARLHPHEPWSTRSHLGTWSTIPHLPTPITTLERP